MNKKEISFPSADNLSTIASYIYFSEEVSPQCVLQISHGMCEYIERYEHFAQYLTSKGVAVVGNDHIGHGGSVSTDDDLGYFGGKGGHKYVLEALF